jgi:hypothetical protein
MSLLPGEVIIIQNGRPRKFSVDSQGSLDTELELGTLPEEVSEVLAEGVMALQTLATAAGLVVRVEAISLGPPACGCDCARRAMQGGDTYEERGYHAPDVLNLLPQPKPVLDHRAPTHNL